MEFHPLIILYMTTKITQKTTSFNGINKPSQSILPSLSTCNSRLQHHTWLPGLRQQEIKWLFSAILSVEEIPGAPGAPTHQIQKTPELWES